MPAKRKRDPAEYNPHERGAIAGYYRNKKGKAETRGTDTRGAGGERAGRAPTPQNFDSDPEIDDYQQEDVGEDPRMEQMVRGAPGGGGGGGSGGGNLGVQEMGDRPFGRAAIRRSKKYTKSFTSYITNGVEDLNWGQIDGTVTAPPTVTWNEGWNLVGGWGVIRAALTPQDWYQLVVSAKRYRVKSCEMEIEGMIPFQEQIIAGGEVTVATASNRPNIWCYVDHDQVLPTNNTTNTGTHNEDWQLPYGKFSTCRLKRPNWNLRNWDVNRATLRQAQLPGATEPQKLMSLLSTGKVKTVYPGQKIKESWTNPVKAWRMVRPTYDEIPFKTTDGGTAINYMQRRANTLQGGYAAGIAGYNENQPTNSAQEITFDKHMNHYADTGLPLKHSGPPYILVKVEPYYDSQDNALNIYMQCHIHYTIDIEWEELDQINTIVPFDFEAIGVVPLPTLATFDRQLQGATSQFPSGNNINVVVGPNPSSSGLIV